MYQLKENQIPIGKTAIITYPGYGTLAMDIVKVENGFVEGLVWFEGSGFNMPEDYHGENEYMNFPITCIREIV
jgi:hypothetical protein